MSGARTKKKRTIDIFIDIRRGGEALGVASDVDLVHWLVDADVVDFHDRGENEVLKVYRSKVLGDAQIGDDILCAECEGAFSPHVQNRIRTIGS